METAVLVVPCFNEAERLDARAFLSLVQESESGEEASGLRLLFVNDGSRDDTEVRLREIAACAPKRIGVLSLEKNVGKAEAVRRGLLEGLARSPAPDVVGYLDADLSTPVKEVARLWALMKGRPDVHVVLGARVALLGRDIRRKPARHYLGRVFASLASMTLGMRVYDTQCGAKLFRCTDALTAALSEPFLSRWAFDVELLGRLLAGTPDVSPVAETAFLEAPLDAWSDVPGSKLRIADMANTLMELGFIGVDLARRRTKSRA